METCIHLQGLTKTFGSGSDPVRAVDGIDLRIGRGEIVALLGPNGAGKTTTIDLILGFIQPSSGAVSVFGVEPRQAVADGRVSAVLQTGGMLRDLKVGEMVELISSTYTNPAPAGQVLERAGIAELADRKIQACSGGQVQRLRFALALLADPDLLLLDEPTAGMDVQGRQTFWAAMRAEASEGRTVVFATHYLQEAEDFAQRTVVMDRGRIVADGATELIRRQTAARTVTATLDQDRVASIAEHLESWDSVRSVQTANQRLTVHTADSDAVARALLVDFGGRDLEIEAASLESAFVNLTDHHDQLEKATRS
jgi:ABC-2 type transport system ATP-binding protein